MAGAAASCLTSGMANETSASTPIPQPIALGPALDELTFLPNRAPGVNPGQGWAATVSDYRDGGVFIVHWAGESEWERHIADEVVMVLDGSTTMTLLIDGEEHEHTLGPMEMIVVPEDTWHRFVTPESVKVLAVSPQPTDHRVDHPLA